jgi:hypothetical protein
LKQWKAKVPKATGRRRVSLQIVLKKGQRAGDPDSYFKSLCAALVHVGMLVDDNPQGVELAPVAFSRDWQNWEIQITLLDLSSYLVERGAPVTIASGHVCEVIVLPPNKIGRSSADRPASFS